MARRSRHAGTHEERDEELSIHEMTIPVSEDMLSSDEEIGRLLQALPQESQANLVDALNEDLRSACSGQLRLFADDVDAKVVPLARDVVDIPKIVRLTHMRDRDGEGKFRISLDLELNAPQSPWIAALLDSMTQKLSSTIAREIISQDIACYSLEFGNYLNIWSISDIRKIIHMMDGPYYIGIGRTQISEMVEKILVNECRWQGKKFCDFETVVEGSIIDEWSRQRCGWHYLSLVSGFTPGFEFHPDCLMFEGVWADEVVRNLIPLFSEHNIFVLLLDNRIYAGAAREYLDGQRI